MKRISICIILLSTVSCTNNVTNNDSVLRSFGYLGFNDTNRAEICGRVVSVAKNIETPINHVQISTNGFTTETDTNGRYKLYFTNGIYNISFKKKDYKGVFLKEYNADSNQISDAEIILNLGDSMVEYNISKNKINKK